jgi:hypothetical protein
VRKNLVLFLILAALLGVTYLVHERGAEIERAVHLEQHQLYNPERLGELTSFSNPAASLVRDGERFVTSHLSLEVDTDKLYETLNVLLPIQARRFLEPQDLEELNLDVAFPHAHYTLKFTFENGSVEYLIGEKLQFSQDFYMRLRWQEGDNPEQIQYVVATDTSPLEGIFSDETYHISDRKYMRLLNLLFLNEEFFVVSSLAPEIAPEDVLRLSFETRTNRPFHLIFDGQKITLDPAPFEHVSLDHALIRGWLENIIQLRGKKFLPEVSLEDLGRVIASLKILKKNGRTVQIDLYRDLEDPHGFYVASTERDGVYTLAPELSGLFLVGHQRFWNRIPVFSWEQEFSLRFSSTSEIKILKGVGAERQGQWLGNPFRARVDTLGAIISLFRSDARMITQGKPDEAHPLFDILQNQKVVSIYRVIDELIFYDRQTDLAYHYTQRGSVALPISADELVRIE